MADGSLAPRLLTTKEAKAYLGGKHPAALGCSAIGRLWDRIEIDHRLDQRAGIESPAGARKGHAPADDSVVEDELAALEGRINRAARGV
jgi:hypothetical protein